MSEIRKCFISRWGKDGYVVEFDLSQIEVVCQAFLTQSRQMIRDIKDGVDFHCKRLAFKLGEDYETIYHKHHVEHDPSIGKQRKAIKVFSFRRAYGAGAATIAEGIGIPVSEVKKFIEIEEKLYPEITATQTKWIKEVEGSRVPSLKRSPKGIPIGYGILKSVTGKRYIFFEEDLPDWLINSNKYSKKSNKLVGFSPTKIKNYPIQGLAGEILYILLGDLYRALMQSPIHKHCLLTNTVHDSILFDVHKDYLEDLIELIKDVFSKIHSRITAYFGIDFNVPINAEMEWGINWGNMENKLIF